MNVDKAADNDTSLSLVDRVRAKESDAWRQLTDLYGPLVYHWCRSHDVGPEDSADILQEVFRSVASHIDAFEKKDGEGSFRGWLWTITRNRILDLWKKNVPEAKGGSDWQLRVLNVPEAEPPEADDPASAMSALVRRAAEMIRREFRQKTWRAFWRTTVDDIPPDIVADELGMKLPAVYQAKSRVLRRLRKFLDEPALG
jgi:RNA polymerase sigma-70 factor, ECF subfamily